MLVTDESVKEVNKTKPGKIRLNNVNFILDAAELEFASYGYAGTKIAHIAQRAQIPRPNVHYYFDSKQALYSAVLRRALSQWNETFDGVTVDDDPAEVLQQYIHAKVMMSKTHPLASKIYSTEIIHGAPHLDDFLTTEHRKWTRQKAKIIQAWIDQGKMDPVDPFKLLFMIWSSTEHYADFDCQILSVLNREKLSDAYFQSAAKDITHIILKGCGLSPPP